MLIRAWLLISGLWAAYVLGLNAYNGSEQWGLVISVAAFPVVLVIALRMAFRWVVLGALRRYQRVRVYRP